jgi:hypothetical protein
MQLNFPKGGAYKLMLSRSSFPQYKTVTVFVGLFYDIPITIHYLPYSETYPYRF